MDDVGGEFLGSILCTLYMFVIFGPIGLVAWLLMARDAHKRSWRSRPKGFSPLDLSAPPQLNTRYEGLIDDVFVRFELIYSASTGVNSVSGAQPVATTDLRCHCELPCDGFYFRVYRRTRFSALFKTKYTLKTGDLEFDNNFVVDCADARWARALLSPSIRRHFLDYLNEGRGDLLTMSDGFIHDHRNYTLIDSTRLYDDIGHLVALSQALTEAAAPLPAPAWPGPKQTAS